MGKGVSLQFRRAFPGNYDAYAAAVAGTRSCPADVHLGVRSARGATAGHQPSNQRHWRGRSRLADIESGLDDLRRVLIERDIRSSLSGARLRPTRARLVRCSRANRSRARRPPDRHHRLPASGGSRSARHARRLVPAEDDRCPGDTDRTPSPLPRAGRQSDDAGSAKNSSRSATPRELEEASSPN